MARPALEHEEVARHRGQVGHSRSAGRSGILRVRAAARRRHPPFTAARIRIACIATPASGVACPRCSEIAHEKRLVPRKVASSAPSSSERTSSSGRTPATGRHLHPQHVGGSRRKRQPVPVLVLRRQIRPLHRRARLQLVRVDRAVVRLQLLPGCGSPPSTRQLVLLRSRARDADEARLHARDRRDDPRVLSARVHAQRPVPVAIVRSPGVASRALLAARRAAPGVRPGRRDTSRRRAAPCKRPVTTARGGICCARWKSFGSCSRHARRAGRRGGGAGGGGGAALLAGTRRAARGPPGRDASICARPWCPDSA